MKKTILFFFFIFSGSQSVFAYDLLFLPIHDNDVEINGGGWYYSEEPDACVASRSHAGFDFDGENGSIDADGDGDNDGGITEVYAAADGVVEEIDNSCYGETSGWGCYVEIIHDVDSDGEYDYRTMHAHLYHGSVDVIAGQTVTPDTFLGYVGDTGASQGAHLHFGLQDYGSSCNTALDVNCWSDLYNLYNATSNPTPTCCDLPNGCPDEKSRAGDTSTFDCSNADDGNYLWATCPPVFLEDSTPGLTEDGWNSTFSSFVYEAYQRNGGHDVLGDSFDDGGGIYLHEWEDGIFVQNFGEGDDVDEYAILTHEDLLDDESVNSASVIRHAFWYAYSHYDGPNTYGLPLGDEMDVTKLEDESLNPYDPVCDEDGDYAISLTEGESCIEIYCGSTDYESMQRFENGELCYESGTTSVVVAMNSGTYSIASYTSPGESSAVPSDTSAGTVDCDALAGSGSVTYCTEDSGFDDCIQYSNNECSVTMNLAWLDSVNNIQWGEVEDENDAYVIGEYQISWRATDANVIYYGVSDPSEDCDETGCSTGTAYSSTNSLTTVTAPGVASYERTLAYRVNETADCTFYCYAYFDAFEPMLDYDSIYVLNCYDSDDCSEGEYCNKSGSWESWDCAATKADDESCTADEECLSGHCYEVTTGICYTPTAVTDADTDGLSDEEETSLGSDLNNSDTDDDGLSDYLEVISRRSDPTISDTDEDGVSDYSDLCPETTDFDTVDTNGCAADQMRILFTLTAHDQDELGPEGGDADGNFGGVVSLDGDVVVVGASEADAGGARPGAVYVFRWDGSRWNEEAKLTASDDGGLYPQFGKALAVSDDVIVVGDYGDNVQNLGSGTVDDILDTSGGAAYVFRWDGTNWNEEAKLIPSDFGYYGFGYSVAVSGDVIVVSSIDYELLDCSPSAYVYRWDGVEWQEEDHIVLPDAQDYTAYAPYSPVAVKDDTFVIGAPYADSGGTTDSGAAYVYRFDGDHWGLETTLTAPSPESDGYFGISVDVDRDMVIAAASGSEEVFIYNGPLGDWVQVGTLNTLSYSASLSGDLALIGDQSGSSSLAYRWFGSWTEVPELSQDNDSTAGGDIDGERLALRGDSAIFIYHNILNPTLDTDRDGVSDDTDAFPTDVTETTDTDADGVGDNSDSCPDTPADETADENGCGESQRDTDSDGVVDSTVICDDTTDVDTADEEGCSDEQRDSDSDGVLNNDDDCPNTSRVSGLDYIESNGCAWSDTDTDGDGLSDYEELVTYGETMTTEIYGSDSTTLDYFGFSVAIDADSNTIVVGAPEHDAQGSNSGAAYVYTWDGSNWNETKLMASDGEEGDHFGNAVSINGDTIAVAAYAEDHESAVSSGTSTGVVYIYRWDGSVWNEEQKVVGETEAFNTSTFGSSIDLSDDHLIVGDYGAYCVPSGAESAEESGAATIFAWDGSSWNLEERLTASDCAANDNYGRSVAIYNDVAVVGAYSDDDVANGSGAAFVYDYDTSTSTWSLNTKLTPSSLGELSYFGYKVDASENIVAVGAKGDGVTYPFHYDGANWNEGETLDYGGYGAVLFEDSLFTIYHQAVLYDWNGSNWESTRELSGSEMAIAMNSSLLVIGDTSDNTSGDGAGAVAIYDRSDPQSTDYADADSDDDGLSDGDEVEIYGSNPLDPDTTDGDGDGFLSTSFGGTDCNDEDASINSTAEEICDGIDNNCDDSVDPACDDDGDHLTNEQEAALGTDPNNPDTDGDRLSDGAEVNLYGTDPNARDTDGDRLNDSQEVRLHHTDPNDSDTDDDGMPDGMEVRFGRDPLDPEG